MKMGLEVEDRNEGSCHKERRKEGGLEEPGRYSARERERW